MKIEGVQVSIKLGSLYKAGQVFVLEGDNEKNIRSSCFNALKKAKKAACKKAVFFVGDMAAFPAAACAKILAQEIYRHIKEDKPTIKKIEMVLDNKKNFKIFDKTITGYLTHLSEVLTKGPFVTVDTIIEVKGGIVLIKRSNPPFGWAIPGGFVDYNESLEEAAEREAFEETGLKVKNLRQMHTYSLPGRDPRFHTVTTVFVCQASGDPCAASDAAEAVIFNPDSWQKLHLAFDHRKVLSDYLKFKKNS